MTLEEAFNRETILFLNVETREEALKQLTSLLCQNEKIREQETFYKAVCEREALVSTGIGAGIAIPHAKMATFKHFHLGVGIQQGNGIPWEAIDNTPVKLVFLIAGPEDQQRSYLTLLSELTALLRNRAIKRALLQARDREEVARILEEAFQKKKG